MSEPAGGSVDLLFGWVGGPSSGGMKRRAEVKGRNGERPETRTSRRERDRKPGSGKANG